MKLVNGFNDSNLEYTETSTEERNCQLFLAKHSKIKRSLLRLYITRKEPSSEKSQELFVRVEYYIFIGKDDERCPAVAEEIARDTVALLNRVFDDLQTRKELKSYKLKFQLCYHEPLSVELEFIGLVREEKGRIRDDFCDLVFECINEIMHGESQKAYKPENELGTLTEAFIRPLGNAFSNEVSKPNAQASMKSNIAVGGLMEADLRSIQMANAEAWRRNIRSRTIFDSEGNHNPFILVHHFG